MNVQEIIDLGNAITANMSDGFAVMRDGWWIAGLFALLFAFCVGGFIGAIEEDAVLGFTIGIFVFLIFYVLGIFVGADSNKSEVKEARIEAWKQEKAYPYIRSRPVEKGEAVFLKVEPQLGFMYGRWRGYHMWMQKEQLTPLTTSFKRKDTVLTITDWYDASMSLTSEQLPYVEYQYLEENLPHGLGAGVYYPKVFLPSSYKFTDIK